MTAALVMSVGGVGCKTGSNYVDLESVSTATTRPDAKGFLVQGKPLVDRMVDHRWTQTKRTSRGTPTGKTTRHTYLVPVVDEAWSEGQPISMWLTCPSQKACLKGPAAWLDRIRRDFLGKKVKVEVADRVGRETSFHRPSSQWLDGTEAAKEQGLPSAHHAAIVRWPVE